MTMSIVASRRGYHAHVQRGAARSSKVRTGELFGLEVDIGGAGVPEWQKTNRALLVSNEEINAWSKSVEKKLADRAKSDDWPDCDEEASRATDVESLAPCLTPAENDANQFLRDTWNPLVKEWNALVARAKTGVPWGEDAELRAFQGRIVAARREFSERSGYKWKRELPAWSPDRGFFEAIKQSTGVDVPGAAKGLLGEIPWTTIALAAGVGLGAVLLLKSK